LLTPGQAEEIGVAVLNLGRESFTKSRAEQGRENEVAGLVLGGNESDN